MPYNMEVIKGNPMNENELLEMQSVEVMELIEDSVEYICNENVLSGQKVWTMIVALAEAKLNQFPKQ
jgi:hypothetical protein|tara:strand:- start:16 stop:216 length:201 start_codon:yes stop_codon:yes gene_type:complete